MSYQKKIRQQLTEVFASSDPSVTLVITPNNRLSRFINREYAIYKASNGQTSFATLACYSISQWLHEWWRNCVVDGFYQETLLSPVLERFVWEEVLNKDPETPALINIPATAKLASKASGLLYEWSVSEQQLLAYENNVFQRWRSAFTDNCQMHQWVTEAQLATYITHAIKQYDTGLPQKIYCFGFDDVSPSVSVLFKTLEAQKVSIESFDVDVPAAKIIRFEFQDEKLEIIAAATWAKNLLEQEFLEKNTIQDKRIGIVIPELENKRQEVEQIFSRVFEPEYIVPNQPQHAPGYNISAAQPLAQVPIVSIALIALRMMVHNIDIAQVTKLLLSPFVGINAELGYRSQVDILVREKNEPQINMQFLKLELQGYRNNNDKILCADFSERIKQFEKNSIKLQKSRLSPSVWSEKITQQLQCLNWPGDRKLDTVEYQQVQAWMTAMSEFSSADVLDTRLTLSQALNLLQQTLINHNFQVQTKTSPIQVLGMLEAAGLPFDHLWIMHLNSEAWPAPPSPNPLLPTALQVKLKMPQSSAEREREYAVALKKRFESSAEEVVYSSACSAGDKQLQPSPLIMDIKKHDFDLELNPDIAELLFNVREVEYYTDPAGSKVVNPENIRGGTQILKSQAACPFQSFAHHRLLTNTVPEPETGLSNMERGNLVHSALEYVWRKLLTQQTLLETPEEQLNDIIHSAIFNAFKEKSVQQFIGNQLIAMESDRIYQLVRAWLELEKQRQPFSVLFSEKSKTISVGGLPVRVRYDRIDLLQGGGVLVLDYKTGEQKISSWAGERPDEPQVPLYALALDEKVVGAAFGQVSSKGIAIKGIAIDESIADGIKTPEMLTRLDLPGSWLDILQQWKRVLDSLAHDFLAGDARVMPKNIAITCRYCELQVLCRIHETTNSSQAQADNVGRESVDE